MAWKAYSVRKREQKPQDVTGGEFGNPTHSDKPQPLFLSLDPGVVALPMCILSPRPVPGPSIDMTLSPCSLSAERCT